MPKKRETAAGVGLTRVVGENLRRLRTERRESLEELARASGVSRSMLSQIELGQSTPTINVLFKIAQTLNQPFSALLEEARMAGPRIVRALQIKSVTSRDGKFVSRALFTLDARQKAEGYELHLVPEGVRHADAHAPGTSEYLAVVRGALDLTLNGAEHHLGPGDVIVFAADVPHIYRNRGKSELVMFLVMTYGERPTIR